MTETITTESLIAKIAASDGDLRDRIAAVDTLAASPKVTLAELQQLIRRPRVVPPEIINSDPEGEERVVDLYLIWAMCKQGSNEQLNQIPILIANASNKLQGPDNELVHAATVIKRIADSRVIGETIDLTNSNDARVVKNALTVLDLLQIANPPIGGSTSSMLPSTKFDFKFKTLATEIEQLVIMSKGIITISSDAQASIRANDYDRGEVILTQRSLQERIEEDLVLLNYYYYLEKSKVIVCTPAEAGKKWRDWWGTHSDAVKFK